MAELANLRIVVDSTSAKTAERDLKDLTVTAGNTGRAVDKLIASNERMADAMRSAHKPTLDAVRYLNDMQQELQTVGKSAEQIRIIEIKMAAAKAPTAQLAKEIRDMGAELIRAEIAAKNTASAQEALASSTRSATNFIDQMNKELMTVGKSSAEIFALNVKMAAAQAPTKALAADIDRLGAELLSAKSAADLAARQIDEFGRSANASKAYVDSLNYELNTIGKSSLQIKAMEIKMAAARAPTAELAQEIRNMGAELLRAERNAQTITPHIDNVGNGSKLASHHAQNLAFQLQDVGVSLASGQKPMTVFFQQGSQIAQIAMQAGLSIGEMAKATLELAGTAARVVLLNPVFLSLAAVVTTGMVAFKDFQNEVGKTGELEKFQASLGLTKKEIKELEEAVGPAAITMGDVFTGLGKTISDALILGPIFDAFKEGFFATFRFVSELASDVAAGIYAVFVGTFKGIVETYKMLPAALGDVLTQAVNGMSRSLESFLNGFIASTNAILSKFKLPTIDLVVDIPELQNRYAGAANAAGTAFTGQIKQAFSDAKAGFSAAGDTLSANIIDAAKERMQAGADTIIDERVEKKLTDAAAKAAAKAAAELAKMLNVNLIMDDLEQAFNIKATIKANIEFDEKDFRAQIEAARERQVVTEVENRNFALATATQIGDIIGGSLGEGISKLADLISKDFPLIMSGFGSAFKSLESGLNKVLASFGTSLKGIGESAEIGVAVAGITGGGKTGAAIGGAIGGAAGAAIGMALGGPAGAVVGKFIGSVIGGAVGGLFKKTKEASATISASVGKLDIASMVSNDPKFKATTNALASALINGLNKAANALGAELTDALNISIGQRDKKFVVDPMGLGRTKGAGTSTFEVEADAIAFALDNLIRRGIFKGLRAGTERLLNGFGDVEERLSKAIEFESVFKAVRANIDPVGLALETLDKKFVGLIALFHEAGASAEEFATLEQYYQEQRIKAIDEANRVAIDKANAARDALISAYERESEAISTTLERFQSLTKSLESFRLTLAEQFATATLTAEQIYASARAKFEEISTLAIAGNEKAISDLVSVSQRYLDAAKSFLTPEDYNREIQNVMKAVDLAIIQTKTMEDYAQLQLDALKNSVDGLMTVNESVLSVRDAIKALKDAQALVQAAPATTLVFEARAATGVDFASMTREELMEYLRQQGYDGPAFANGGMHSGGLRLVGENGPELEATGPSRIYNANQTATMLSGGDAAAQVSALRDEMRASLYAIAKNTGRTANQLVRWDGDGLPEPRNY